MNHRRWSVHVARGWWKPERDRCVQHVARATNHVLFVSFNSVIAHSYRLTCVAKAGPWGRFLTLTVIKYVLWVYTALGLTVRLLHDPTHRPMQLCSRNIFLCLTSFSDIELPSNVWPERSLHAHARTHTLRHAHNYIYPTNWRELIHNTRRKKTNFKLV